MIAPASTNTSGFDRVRAVMEASTGKLPPGALRVCVDMLWRYLSWEASELVAQMDVWEKSGEAHDLWRDGIKGIRKMDETELNRFLLLLAMSNDMRFTAYGASPHTETIEALEKVFGLGKA